MYVTLLSFFHTLLLKLAGLFVRPRCTWSTPFVPMQCNSISPRCPNQSDFHWETRAPSMFRWTFAKERTRFTERYTACM